jgi:hypothetical protein
LAGVKRSAPDKMYRFNAAVQKIQRKERKDRKNQNLKNLCDLCASALKEIFADTKLFGQIRLNVSLIKIVNKIHDLKGVKAWRSKLPNDHLHQEKRRKRRITEERI